MQKRAHSLIESIISTITGLVINLTAQKLIFPLFGIYISWSDNLLIALIFTLISIVRSYVIRRIFTHQTEKHE